MRGRHVPTPTMLLPTVRTLPRTTQVLGALFVLVLGGTALLALGRLLVTPAPQRSAIGGGMVLLALALTAAALAGALVLSLARELERRRDVETQLVASRAKFEGILAIAADAIITVDEAHVIVHFNNGAERLFGWREAEVLGTPLQQLLPERFRRTHERHMVSFAHGPDVARRMGERRAIFGQRRDGSEFPAEASISRLDLPSGRLFTVVLRDMTARIAVEENERFLGRAGVLLAGSLDYESTLRSAVHLAIPHLADCCVLDIVESPGVVRRFSSVHEDPEVTRHLRALERRRVEVADWPFPVATVLASGAPIVRPGPVAPRATAAEHGGGALDRDQPEVDALGIQGLVAVPLRARDRLLGVLTLLATDPARAYGEGEVALAAEITSRAALAIDNAFLFQTAQQAAEARDEVLGVVSHDLRNPLSAISMCARVLFESPPDTSDERRDMAAAILASTQMMQRLIQDLLDVSTIESGHLQIHPRPERLPPIVESALAMVRERAEERGILLERELPLDLPLVRVDAMRVEQVLANLLANAVKFTNGGGRVLVGAFFEAGQVVVRVTDTGVGIPGDDLPHIFDRYWHARRHSRTVGTGLGLAIALGLVEAHGGTIAVQSVVARGTTFTFTLPAAQPAPVADPAPAIPATSSLP